MTDRHKFVIPDATNNFPFLTDTAQLVGTTPVNLGHFKHALLVSNRRRIQHLGLDLRLAPVIVEADPEAGGVVKIRLEELAITNVVFACAGLSGYPDMAE